ncbi:MAG: fimbrial biogenesis chaperone [Henriciella sp.]
MRFPSALRTGFIAFAMAAIAAPAAPFGIGLQPTTVEMSVQPGDRQRQVINLGNVHQEDTISLTLGLADWSLDENGQIALTPPGESDVSAANWVRFSPAFVTLEPGETEQIIVDMAAPIRIDREGDFRFALIASTLLPEERSGQSGVWKKYQIASLFYLTMGNAESKPEIKGASLTQSPDGEQAVVFDLENNGNAHARLRGDVEIRGDGGTTITESISNLVVLHDGKRKYRLPLAQALPANPEVKVTLENIYAPQNAAGAVMLEPFTSDLSFEETAAPAALTDDAEAALE